MVPMVNQVQFTDTNGKLTTAYEVVYGTSIGGYYDSFGNNLYDPTLPASVVNTKTVLAANISGAAIPNNKFLS